ncbi:hypothetical protein DFH27DRAFT_158287 [Peziza echinospora]|nr:hypothetical protein DFH27DRAFT_158287 [Peziza echinospora]
MKDSCMSLLKTPDYTCWCAGALLSSQNAIFCCVRMHVGGPRSRIWIFSVYFRPLFTTSRAIDQPRLLLAGRPNNAPSHSPAGHRRSINTTKTAYLPCGCRRRVLPTLPPAPCPWRQGPGCSVSMLADPAFWIVLDKPQPQGSSSVSWQPNLVHQTKGSEQHSTAMPLSKQSSAGPLSVSLHTYPHPHIFNHPTLAPPTSISAIPLTPVDTSNIPSLLSMQDASIEHRKLFSTLLAGMMQPASFYVPQSIAALHSHRPTTGFNSHNARG